MKTGRLFKDIGYAARTNARLRAVEDPASLLEGLRESEPALYEALAARAETRRVKQQRRKEIAEANAAQIASNLATD